MRKRNRIKKQHLKRNHQTSQNGEQLAPFTHTHECLHTHSHLTHTHTLSSSSSTVQNGSLHRRAPGHPYPKSTAADPGSWLPEYQGLRHCG